VQENDADGYDITVTIAQAVPAYRLRLPLVFETEAGMARHVVEIAGTEQTVTVTLSDAPVSIRLDPDFEIARHPVDGELAPILSAIGGAAVVEAIAATAGDDFQDNVREALSPLIGDTSLTWVADVNAATSRHVLIAGLPDDVLALRPASLGPLPVALDAPSTALWIERDGNGRLWVFLASDPATDLTAALRTLRFYASQSFVEANGDGIATSGVFEQSAGAAAFVIND